MKKSIFIACFALMFANITEAQKVSRYEGTLILPSDLVQMKPFLAPTRDNKGEGFYDY